MNDRTTPPTSQFLDAPADPYADDYGLCEPLPFSLLVFGLIAAFCFVAERCGWL